MALKLNLNALKNLNWKEVFLQHGDKIALISTCTIALLLLITSLLLPGGGIWLLTTPGKNAEDLKKEAETVDRLLASNTPTRPDDKPNPSPKPELPKLSNFRVEDPTKYLVKQLFDVPLQSDSSRRQPLLELPDGGLAIAMLGQIQTYIFTPDNEKVLVLQNVSGTNAQDGQKMQQVARTGKGGRGGMTQPSPGRGLQAPGQQTASEGRTTYKGNYVSLTDLENSPGGAAGTTGTTGRKLATTTRPLPMAKIVASFPLRKQLEEFKTKLRLPTCDAVLSEAATEMDDAGQPLPAFRFLGVRLQRRVVDAAGKPLSTTNDGWTDVNLRDDYKPYLFATGKRFEPDSPEVQSVSVVGLVMPQLVQARKNQYPAIETKLKNIQSTLDEIAKAARDKTPPPAKPLEFQPGSLDIFQGEANATTGPGDQPMGGTPRTRQYPGGRPAAMPPGSDPNAPPQGTNPQTHCLIRVIDVTIKPGTIYEYRMQVRLANPNFGRKNDVASPEYAERKELVSEAWYVIPQKVVVPPEMVYYAVDQKDVEGKSNYKGLNDRLLLGRDQVAFQIHRWVESIDSPVRAFLGEWAVAERLPVTRGEFIGRTVRVKVPVWNYSLDDFDIPQTEKGRQKFSGVEVHFGDSRNEAILVDFDGPDHEYKNAAPKPVRERTTTQVVIFSSNGKLLARDSYSDEKNDVRQKQLQDWRDRVKEVEDKNKKGADNKSGNPFGNQPGK